MRKSILYIALIFCACQNSSIELPDLLITNAQIYTATGTDTISVLAIKDGLIHDVGQASLIDKYEGSTIKTIDAKGQF